MLVFLGPTLLIGHTATSLPGQGHRRELSLRGKSPQGTQPKVREAGADKSENHR